MFRQHRIRQAEAQMAAGTRWRDYGLIFASEIGTPMDPENFSRSFSRLCKRAGLGHWHPHELRHSGASLMLAQGTPLHVVSEVLGHASIAITKDVYGHLLEGEKQAAAESMSRALLGPGGSQKDPEDPSRTGLGASDMGALGGTRTPNLLIRSQMLYPLSYERRSLVVLPAVLQASATIAHTHSEGRASDSSPITGYAYPSRVGHGGRGTHR